MSPEVLEGILNRLRNLEEENKNLTEQLSVVREKVNELDNRTSSMVRLGPGKALPSRS